MSWALYPKGSVGNVLHFLSYICGVSIASHCIIGQSDITYRGEKIATFSFDEHQLPIFCFQSFPDDPDLQRTIDYWNMHMSDNRARAIALL